MFGIKKAKQRTPIVLVSTIVGLRYDMDTMTDTQIIPDLVIIPFRLKRGFFNLQAEIDNARKVYGNAYKGAYDYYEFQLDDTTYRHLSKLSYEEIWEMEPKITRVMGLEEKGNMGYRKFLRISTLLSTVNQRDGKTIIGHPDPETHGSLTYDLILYQLIGMLGKIERGEQIDKMKELSGYLIRMIEANPEHGEMMKDFAPILSYVEKMLYGNQQPKSVNV